MSASHPGGISLVERLHIDTDPGLDDLLALALALASPEARVCGVTTVAGNASIRAVTENAQRFLALSGLSIPIGEGAAGPLRLPRVEVEYHGRDGRRGISIPAIDRRPLPPAHEVLRESLGARRVERIVALGPLTNLALLLEDEPSLFEGVEIVWMGGSLSGGNVTATAEFNCYADPSAAARVLGSGVSVRVIGLDVTRCVRIASTGIPPRSFGASEVGRVLEAVLSAMMDAEEPLAGERQATLHDPCAVLAALPLDLFRYESKRLRVVTDDGHERGRMLEAEPGEGSSDETGVVRYAVEVNTPAVMRLFWERLQAWCEAS